MRAFKTFSRRRKVICAILVMLLLVYVFAARPLLAVTGATMEGTLAANPSGLVGDDAVQLLARVPSLGVATDNGLRFAAMPSFGHRWVAVSLARTDTFALGKAAVLDRASGRITVRSFEMPLTRYDDMVRRWDEESDGYWGDLRGWMDGTPIGFERRRGFHVTSGLGNSPCHFDILGNLAATYIGPQVSEMSDLRSTDIETLRKSGSC